MQGSGFTHSKMTMKTQVSGFLRTIMTVKTQGSASGYCQNPVFYIFSYCQDEAWMESSSWQQEHMQKHRLLATARGRTLCFYSQNGSEAQRKPEPCVSAYVFVAKSRIPSWSYLGNKKP